jgi:NADPH2:quinone reductase
MVDRIASAVVLRQIGGPEVLQLETMPLKAPAPGEILLRQTAIGVNFHDTYVRSGLYQTLRMPGVPGVEAVGVVEAVGAGVTHVAVGERVGYVTSAYGGYADARIIAADMVLRLPDEIDDCTAAGALVKGLTACMLLTKLRVLKAGDTCLVHAAAGGVGQLLCQWAKHRGARVIGTVGSEEKATIARQSGCDHTILYKREKFTDRVRELTDGRGVDVAYDAVGRDTFFGSLECLALRGHLINFGQSSGPVDPFPVSLLVEKSTTVSRPILFHYLIDREERQQMADQLFDALRTGKIRVQVGAKFALAQVADAHRALESRTTMGSTVLIP